MGKTCSTLTGLLLVATSLDCGQRRRGEAEEGCFECGQGAAEGGGCATGRDAARGWSGTQVGGQEVCRAGYMAGTGGFVPSLTAISDNRFSRDAGCVWCWSNGPVVLGSVSDLGSGNGTVRFCGGLFDYFPFGWFLWKGRELLYWSLCWYADSHVIFLITYMCVGTAGIGRNFMLEPFTTPALFGALLALRGYSAPEACTFGRIGSGSSISILPVVQYLIARRYPRTLLGYPIKPTLFGAAV